MHCPACAVQASFSQPRYTQKERDPESGNDYFLARYNTPYFGRFLAPDWSAQEGPVPYASLGDTQSLNLYVKNLWRIITEHPEMLKGHFPSD
jgi:RHS repeat-associated protein